MADNLTLNPGSGGSVLAADDIASVFYQRVKLVDGTADSATAIAAGGGVESGALRVTIASDSTGVLSVDDNAGSLTVDNGGTFAVQVDAALPAGTNAIGKLAANSGVDIGDVDVTSIVPGTGATNLGKAEDAAHTTGDTGVMALSVRQDSAAALGGTDGDYQPLITDANGRLHVIDVGIQAALGGSELQVDIVSSALPSGASTAANQSTANTALAAIQTAVEGTLTIDSELPAAGALADSTGNPTCPAVGSFPHHFNGTNWNRMRGDTSNGLDVDVTRVSGTVTVDNGGTFAVQVDAALPSGTNAIGKLAANSGVDIGDVDVLSVAAGSNLIGDVGISGARTSGGTTIFRSIDLDESEEEVKATAGQIYWIHAMNLASTKRYLKIYNATAATVVVGTTTPVMTLPIPTTGDTNGAGFVLSIPNGIAFGTAITVAATTGIADADTGAPGANEVIVHVGYA